MHANHKYQLPIQIAIIGLSIAVFIFDFFTRVGVAEWVFYLIPVVLSAMQGRRFLPFAVAGIQAIMIAVGLVVSPDGIDPTLAIINRGFGTIVVFVVAFLSYRVVSERLRSQRLLWLQEGQARVARSLLGEQEVHEVGNNVLRALAGYADAQLGVLYRIDGQMLKLAGSYAYTGATRELPLRHGLAGECAADGKARWVTDIPADYIKVASATGGASPRQLLIAPITAEARIIGVMELGFINGRIDAADQLELTHLVGESVGMALRSAMYRQHLKELLEETQRQAEELQAQQEELRVSNEELEEQGRVLLESQTRLENQQAELEQTNVQLEEQTQRLERQKQDLLAAQRAMQRNAEELARASRYKSEFLANMSHELRTPLNSSLILSKLLGNNPQGNLTEEQVRYARTIHDSNNDLLALINDILDLAKVESGHVDIAPEPVSVAGIIEPLRQTFEPVARDKGVALTIGIAQDVPATLVTDGQRLRQVLKNLLSNAFKFTERGEVVLHISRAPGNRIAFAVKDTGIGIPEHQQDVIFEAFRPADGTTSRKYGGTGLGLSISRELAHRLGGDIRVQSVAGAGSTFTLEVAASLDAAAPDASRLSTASGASYGLQPGVHREMAGAAALPAAVPQSALLSAPDAALAASDDFQPIAFQYDDRTQGEHERLILVIEDDPRFASVLKDLAQELDFDCIAASSGEEAIRLAKDKSPSGILLDVGLPDQSGLSVLERLKRDPATRHIPVHMMSVDDHVHTALELGAVGYALKPVAREQIVEAIARLEDKLQSRARQVLVVEDDAALRENIGLLLKAQDVEITSVGTVKEALEKVSSNTYDCMVMDLNLPDASGYDLLEKMAGGGKYSFPPVIVYTGRTLSRDEEQRLRRYSRSIIVKGAKSPERLLDEVTLFLHRVEASMPPDVQKLLLQARQRDAVFEGRQILLAEDDVRNIFALSSVFEPLGAKLEIARNGREAIERLERDDGIDLVLMDLMMPEMDGLQAIREIRKHQEWSRLPIIALTAKAMADDRKNCIDAGASDYIAKPIDIEKLVSLCRVWMPK
ncbi:response regulator [Noviherbaspirillum malthae]|uniref:response regulator n=1 Tax=Noviherbaspirillum malthae TaxID=1260987 RepID=UPI00188FF383|nr:response regulator [Noviherbaspirillum malthae]